MTTRTFRFAHAGAASSAKYVLCVKPERVMPESVDFRCRSSVKVIIADWRLLGALQLPQGMLHKYLKQGRCLCHHQCYRGS